MKGKKWPTEHFEKPSPQFWKRGPGSGQESGINKLLHDIPINHSFWWDRTNDMGQA
jgi:hypothetical protein